MNKKKYKMKYISSVSELRNILTKACKIVQDELCYSNNKPSHSFEHTLRVIDTCFNLALELGAYIDIVLLAAIFHDIGRPIEDKTGKCHAEVGAEKARLFLHQEHLDELIQDVCSAIESHRYSKNIEPITFEAKILQDADALDALGAIGLYRTLSFSFERNLNLEDALQHFPEKLLKLSAGMHFPLTRKIAKEKERILLKFVEEIEVEREKTDFQRILNRLK